MRRSYAISFAIVGLLAGATAFILAIVFSGAPIAYAAVSLVQTSTAVSTGNGVTSLSGAFGSTPTQGNLLIAVVGMTGNATTSVSAGWSAAVGGAGAASQDIFYKVAGASETTTFSAAFSGTVQAGIQLFEYSGLSPVVPLDATSSATGNSTSTNGASLTTAEPNELVFAASTIDAQTSFTSWSNSFTMETDFGNGTGPNANRGTYSAADLTVTATGTYSSVGTAAASGAWIGQIVSFRPKITFTQAAYRWFADANGTDVGAPLAAQNVPMTQTTPGTPFRLRMLINVGTNQLAAGTRSFKLQYVDEATGTCASPGGGNVYADVPTSGSPIQFYNNAGPSDGTALTPTSTDPVDGTSTIVNQTYEEANPFTNSQSAIPAGEDGKWDFSLVDNNASSSHTYCFRAVASDGTPFSTYSAYPSVVIGNLSPTVTNVTLNSGNDITLIVATTTTITATATADDPNGYTDIAFVTSTFYRTSLGSSCTANANNCYQIPSSSCSLSGCAGTSCTVSCSANIWYFAEPTDSGTPWAGDSWTAAMTATDHSNATSGVVTSTPVSLLSLLGLDVTPSISYGTFSPGGAFSSLTVTTTVTETGNVSTNADLYGINMTSGSNSLAVGDQHYATASIPYASGTTLLANPGTTTILAIPKTTASSSPGTATFYWGIAIPNPSPSGNFTGVNTFVAVKNSLPWP